MCGVVMFCRSGCVMGVVDVVVLGRSGCVVGVVSVVLCRSECVVGVVWCSGFLWVRVCRGCCVV